MPGHLSPGRMAQAPYVLRIELAVCQCATYPSVLATGRNLATVIKHGMAYWALLCGFWGDLPNITLLTIVDVRDGVVMWRNGRQQQEEDENGEKKPVGSGGKSAPGPGPGGTAVGDRADQRRTPGGR